MPQPKKQHLKKRPDGRYACRYKNLWFYGQTEREALEAREDYKRREALGIKPPSEVTVAEFGAKWLPVAKAGITPQTYAYWACLLEKALAEIGDAPMAEVTPIEIKRIYTNQFSGRSASYIRGGRQILLGLFDAAIAEGIRTDNPARDKSALPHKGKVGGHRAITAQERHWIETLCTDNRIWPAVMTMLYAGLRPQEVKALNVDRSVDFEMDTIRLVDFVHIKDANHYRITGEGKTARATRTIPLLSKLRPALKGRHGLLLSDGAGEPMTIQAWKRAWETYVRQMETAINGCQKRWYGRTREHKAILAAGGQLPPWISFTVRPYDLRHSFATFCRDHGVEMHTCIAWMGHTDAGMILRVYDEVTDTRSAAEAARLEKAIKPKSVVKKVVKRKKKTVQRPEIND